MINKEKDFTLVELLAVIVILGIILAIAVPALGRVIENAQEDANAEEIALVEDADRLYFVANSVDSVDVDVLLGQGYLEDGDEYFETRYSGPKTINKTE